MKESNVQRKIYGHLIPVIYYCIVVIMIGMIVINIHSFGDRKTSFGLGPMLKLEEGWVDAKGNAFDFNDPDAYHSAVGREISVFHRIHPRLSKCGSVVFRTKNAAVQVLIDGRKVYETDITEGIFYNRSPGTRWNIFPVTREDAGKDIEMKIKLAYQDERSKVDRIYVGDSTTVILKFIDSKGTSALLCFLMFAAGIVYYIAGAVLNYKQKEKDYSLMYLASFATISAVWCLIETNLLQLFFDNIRILQVVDNMMLVIGGMPLFLYMDGMYGIFKYRCIRFLCILDLVYMIAATFLHMFGWFDYHQTLNGMVISYICIVVLLGFCVIRQAIIMRGQKMTRHERFSHIMQQIGMVFLTICTACDLIAYMCMDAMDRAVFIRMGLFIFILFFGFGNIYRLIELVKQGLQTELIRRLAYTDGLTGVGNRTAYTEHLEEIVKKPVAGQYGIAIFDINDLKGVNDVHGHTAGDNLIKSCARMIEESFLDIGKLYRLGGDEFAVVLTGINAESLYELAIKELQEKMREQQGIFIAYGASFSDEPTTERLHHIQIEADQRMYENKNSYKASKNANLDDKTVIC